MTIPSLGSELAVTVRDENIIVLDDESSIWQRLVGVLVLVMIVLALAVPIGRGFDGNAEVDVTQEPDRQQAILDMCGPWSVPDSLQSVASFAYPGWSWVCRLVQP